MAKMVDVGWFSLWIPAKVPLPFGFWQLPADVAHHAAVDCTWKKFQSHAHVENAGCPSLLQAEENSEGVMLRYVSTLPEANLSNYHTIQYYGCSEVPCRTHACWTIRCSLALEVSQMQNGRQKKLIGTVSWREEKGSQYCTISTIYQPILSQ